MQGAEGTVVKAAVTGWLEKRKASSQKTQKKRTDTS